MHAMASRPLVSSLRTGRVLVRSGRRPEQTTTRLSHGYHGYREWNYEPNRPFIQRLTHVYGGVMWCFMFWSFRHNWRELVGEKTWPNRDLWTNEHLGIPADE